MRYSCEVSTGDDRNGHVQQHAGGQQVRCDHPPAGATRSDNSYVHERKTLRRLRAAIRRIHTNRLLVEYLPSCKTGCGTVNYSPSGAAVTAACE